jgi:hypothetical protein
MPLLRKTPVQPKEAAPRIAHPGELEQVTILVKEIIKHESPSEEELQAAFSDPNAACLTYTETFSGYPRAAAVVRVDPNNEEVGEIIHLASLHPEERDRLVDYARVWFSRRGVREMVCSDQLLKMSVA